MGENIWPPLVVFKNLSKAEKKQSYSHFLPIEIDSGDDEGYW